MTAPNRVSILFEKCSTGFLINKGLSNRAWAWAWTWARARALAGRVLARAWAWALAGRVLARARARALAGRVLARARALAGRVLAWARARALAGRVLAWARARALAGRAPGLGSDGAGAPGVKHRAQALDIVRAAAALAVLTYHVWLYRLPNPNRPSRDGLFDFALFEFRAGLIVFFVMSGYLLYRPLLRGGRDGAPRTVPLGQYYWRRVVRIVPGYYLAIAGSILLLWGLEGTPGRTSARRGRSLEVSVLPAELLSRHATDARRADLDARGAGGVLSRLPGVSDFGSPLGRRAWLVPLALIVLGV